MTLCVGCNEIIDEIWVEDPDDHVSDLELSDGTIIRLCNADLDYCEDCADDDQGYYSSKRLIELLEITPDEMPYLETIISKQEKALRRRERGEEKKH